MSTLVLMESSPSQPRGADIEAQDERSVSPLLTAASHGKLEAFQALLERGAFVDVVDKNGKSAVYLPAEANHINILKVRIGTCRLKCVCVCMCVVCVCVRACVRASSVRACVRACVHARVCVCMLTPQYTCTCTCTMGVGVAGCETNLG